MIKRFVPILLAAVALIGSCFLPSWALVGSVGSWFSWSTAAMPAVGATLCWPLFYAILMLKFACGTASFSLFYVAKRLPLFVAARALKQKSYIWYCLLPFAAMAFFMSHAQGSQVWWYALHWCVPLALYFVKDSLYSRALAASYIAHAVGSCVWLYAGHVSVEQWQFIAYLVPFERFLFAAGMVVAVRAVEECKHLVTALVRRVVHL